jgi:large conductance mechanosensitive channel
VKMFNGFRDFILRGNIVDLAVGVVIGVAFNSLVEKFTGDFINPLIGVISGGKQLSGSFTVGHQIFNWGDFITAIINFVIVAAVLYFLVVTPMNKLAALRKRGVEVVEAPLPSDEVVLLTQIRDELRANGGALPAQRHGGKDEPALDSGDATRQS